MMSVIMMSVIMMSVIMMSAIRISVIKIVITTSGIMTSGIMMCVIIISVIKKSILTLSDIYDKCPYDECHYDKCPCAGETDSSMTVPTISAECLPVLIRILRGQCHKTFFTLNHFYPSQVFVTKARVTSGLYYKTITIVIDAPSVVKSDAPNCSVTY